MSHTRTLGASLRALIEREYALRGYEDGWRLLYSPLATLSNAPVAFIGLNPGGKDKDWIDHADLCMPDGQSAYVHETWKNRPPGEERLQRQVRAVFARLNVEPTAVLAGNLIPFRSRDWTRLSQKKQALTFGQQIWKTILAAAKPRTIVTMGGDTFMAVCELVSGGGLTRVPTGWGEERAYKATFRDGDLIGLPHLSRRPVMGRAQSESALRMLFSTDLQSEPPALDEPASRPHM